jgi:hypothetical protein
MEKHSSMLIEIAKTLKRIGLLIINMTIVISIELAKTLRSFVILIVAMIGAASTKTALLLWSFGRNRYK